MQSFITHLGERQESWLVGPKAASLARLYQAGFNVPDAFVLTTQALDDCLAHNGLTGKLDRLLADMDQYPLQEKSHVWLCEQAALLRQMISTAVLPENLSRGIDEARGRLGTHAVSVRSSSSLEDTGNRSFAGQHDSFLNILDKVSLTDAIKRVWASAYTDRAVVYLHSLGISLQEIRMAVIVQTMVQAQIAGVAFSINPVSGSQDQLHVSASYGLGESTVSGAVTPDEAVLDKLSLTLLEYRTGDKKQQLVASEKGGLKIQAIDAAECQSRVLSEHQLKKLGEEVIRIESLNEGNPQDIEWALVDDLLFVLQARPVVVVNSQDEVSWDSPVPGAHWKRNWRLGEWLPDAVTPLFASWILPALVASREEFGTGALGWSGMDSFSMPRPWFCILNGFFYTRQDFPGQMQALSVEERVARMVKSRERISAWKAESLPAYIRHFYEDIKTQQLEQISNEQLLDFVDQLVAEAGEFWSFIAPLGYGFEEMIFKPLYDKLIPGEKPHYSLLFSGYESRLTQAQRELWEMAEKIKSDGKLVVWLEKTDPQTFRLDDPSVPGWLAKAIQQFDETYGHQVLSLDIYWPTLGETPQHTLSSLKALAFSEVEDPGVTLARVKERREEAVTAVLERLASVPEKRAQFADTIAYYQGNAAVREDCNFYLQIGWPLIRQSVGILADRLVAAGLLDSAEQVYFLLRDELRALVDSLAENKLTARNVAYACFPRLSNARKSTWENQRGLSAPDSVPLDEGEKKSAWAPDKGILSGIGVSPGSGTGAVRCVVSDADAMAFQKGEVLVIRAASPLFTPLMLLASALVVEVGGGASHSSLVARELGLPAVANAVGATRVLQNGQQVCVDGNHGTVRVVSVQEGVR